MNAFTGYSYETIEFFMAIRFNNNREFFHANHDWYERSVRRPSIALAEELQDTMFGIDPEMEVRPNRAVARINRDIRFSKDKSPYRDFLWLHYRRPAEEKGMIPAFYFDIGSSGEVSCGMGFYSHNRGMLNALRQYITKAPDSFRALIAPLMGKYDFFQNSFKRIAIPDSVPADLEPWYRLKSFYLQRQSSDMELISSPALADWCKEAFLELAPLYRFLMELTPLDEMPTDVAAPKTGE